MKTVTVYGVARDDFVNGCFDRMKNDHEEEEEESAPREINF